MIEIIPALLPKTIEGFEHGLERLRGVAPLVQVDLVDANIFADEEAMPMWEEFDFEFDIMLPNPAAEVETCVALGASRIVVHADARNARKAAEELQHLRRGDFPVEVGIALRAHDEVSALAPFEGLYDYVQVMGIDTIGSQGNPPDPHHKEISLLKALRAAHPDLILQVDGAVAAHPRELVQAGANRLVVGSAIVRADNPNASYKEIYTEVNGA